MSTFQVYNMTDQQGRDEFYRQQDAKAEAKQTKFIAKTLFLLGVLPVALLVILL